MRYRLTVLAIASAAALTACGDASDNPSSSGTPTAGSKTLPYGGAPAVTNPIDASAYKTKPCNMLSNQQLDGAGFPHNGLTVRDASDASTGPNCFASWVGDQGLSFTIGLELRNKDGLSAQYAQQKNPAQKAEVFKPRGPVNGYPSVEVERKASQVEPGGCYLVVGIRNDLDMHVVMNTRKSKFSKDPCGTAATVAGLAIDTMKKGS